MFKEYEVVLRATVMTTGAHEAAAMQDLQYRLTSALNNIDNLLTGDWSYSTLSKEKTNETTNTTQENPSR